ncbi:serine protease [Providencia rettgeri]|nr:serine protease [Providencia rettgeri]
MSISQFISSSTVRILCDTSDGESVGTGFWFLFEFSGEMKIPVIVTNKHVVEGAININLCCNVSCSAKPKLKLLDVKMTGGGGIIYHPDPEIDLCIIPMAELIEQLRENETELENFFFQEHNLLNENIITQTEDVYMTGYPNGLWDSVNNRPITRKGITASSPIEDWKGNPEFMIDMACYGGSSGSPVYVMNEGPHTRQGGIFTGDRLILLGILYAGPTINANGCLEVVSVPTSTTAVVSTKMMMNLGIVIKAEKLNDFKPLLGITP